MTRTLSNSPLPWHREHWQQALALFASGGAGHAYMLCGEADTGKSCFAGMLAEYLLCRTPDATAACGRCPSCLLNAAGSNPDLMMISPEEGSKQIKVDQIRDLRHFLETRAHGHGRRVVILDAAENLGIGSANALLKGLEEPPQGVVFLLLSDRPKAVLATISSRTQVFRLPCPDRPAILAWLLSNAATRSASDLELIVDLAQGRPFVARAILDSGTAEQLQEIGNSLLALAQGSEYPLAIASRYSKSLCAEFLGVLMYWLSELTKYRMTAAKSALKGASLQAAARLLDRSPAGQDASHSAKTQQLIHLYNAAANAQAQLIGASNPNTQLMLEDLLLNLRRVFQAL